MDPDVVTQALGFEPEHSWRRGDQRTTPDCKPLPGTHRHSYWSAYFPNDAGRPAREFIESAIIALPEANEFWSELRETGGSAMLVISLVGTTYQGAEIKADLVAKVAQMGIDLGLEVYAVPQSD